jgi:hypothetical protein
MTQVYVYGILAADAHPPLDDRGVDGGPLGCVAHEDLAALVGEGVDDPVRPSRRNMLAHSGVLQHVVAAGIDVLPMQFGVVMPDAAAVRGDLLAHHAATLREQLAAHAGRVELDVTVRAPEDAVVARVIRGDARLAREAARLRGVGADAAYYDRIALGEAVARGVAAERARVEALVLDALTPFAAGAVASEPRHEDMLASVALLVERARLPEFDAAVERLGEHAGDEAQIRCLGPLPPYHFADLALEETAWA